MNGKYRRDLVAERVPEGETGIHLPSRSPGGCRRAKSDPNETFDQGDAPGGSCPIAAASVFNRRERTPLTSDPFPLGKHLLCVLLEHAHRADVRDGTRS